MKLESVTAGAAGKRIAELFEKILLDIGCESDDWTVNQDSEGVHIRLLRDNNPEGRVSFRLDETEKEVVLKIQRYQDRVFGQF